MRCCSWLAVVALLVAAPAQATLLKDGGFERPTPSRGLINDNDYASMPGRSGKRSWDVWREIGAWSTVAGHGIEVQTRRTIRGAAPHSGDYYVELDSHPGGASSNTTMAQMVNLDPGAYRLSYWYQPRTHRSGDNGLEVLWDGVRIGRHDETSRTQAGWLQHVADVHVATAGDHTLEFTAFGGANTLGALIDTVELNRVPEPGMWPLLGAGLAALAYLRRHRSA